ncbi:HlyD family efflux transporter periplasmic adaptor subunit [Coprococcus catus]|uniref:HlyD family efflux transporter periplasmic adaptor subunit n=1 Tax=Coprococcus catus TaxID=116085 RepID=UPI001C8C151B|nr:HlyD family efflux transporter periplasmic adaptor subunit [Coprococcus catus]MBX9231171.1 biotin/lipoyl-binding protein [Coprococcus catus]MCT6801100.1 biotin/lipoyl-binding protein [Coprococcus catus]
MKLKQLMDFEMDKDKKSSLQVKAIKALAGFLILMFLLTILSRAADSLTIAKVTASAATGGVISHNIETDGNITPNKDIAISTSADIKIASVEATEGKTVKKGDVLIQLDLDDLKTKLLKAQKDLAVAQATASDKKANKAIEADNKARSLERSYEDYNQTISDADDAVSKAKDNMSEAWKAYNDYKKNNNNNSDDTDTTVSDSLQKTVEEKQEAYDKAVDELDGVEKHIEAEVQDEIKSEKEKGVKLSLADEQKIRERVNAYQENVSLLKNANDKVDKAKDALSEAENALSAYNEQQNNNSSASYDEQLKALYDDYKSKEEAYDEAIKQRKSTIQSADRSLEDANTPESVDTASALTENDDLQEKQLAVDKLQKVMDAGGKVTAPSDGLVTKVNVTTGEATTEDTAIRISDQSAGYKFTATLDKSDAKFLAKDDKVTLDLGNGTSVEGLKIQSIDVSQEDKNSYELTVSIPAKVKKIGTIATLKVEKASKKYDTCVPLTALHSDGDKYYVYVINEKDTILGTETAVDKVQVEILDKNNEQAAIDGTFSWDQKFVLTSSKTLRDGDRVRLLEEQ